MAAYTTYKFYQTVYRGILFTEEAVFERYMDRAQVKIDRMTFDRLTEGLPEEERLNTKIQKCICSVAEVLWKLDEAKKTASSSDSGNIRSVSSGGESITFGTDRTEVTEAIGSVRAQDDLIYRTALDYLSGSGLLYSGVD